MVLEQALPEVPSSSNPPPRFTTDSMGSQVERSPDEKTWVDISPLLARACQDMAVGQLLHGEDFSLFEAMVAIEIMDPKMDSAMAYLQEDKKTSGSSDTPHFKSAHEAIQGGWAPTSLSAQSLVDVMDQLLCLQATWYAGQSLAQTLFSCVYLLDMPHIQHNHVLYAFCRTVLALCNAVRGLAIKANTREEEDFVTSAFGLPLAEHMGHKSVEALREMQDVLSDIDHGIPVDEREMGIAGLDWRGTERETHTVLLRISLLLGLFDVINLLEHATLSSDLILAGRAVSEAQRSLANLAESTGPSSRESSSSGAHEPVGDKPMSAETQGDVARIVALEEGHRDSSGAGEPVQAASRWGSSKCTASGRGAPGFCESISIALLPPAPMRAVSLLTWDSALDLYRDLLCHLALVCACHEGSPDLLSALRCLSRFHSVNPGPVARSCMTAAVFAGKNLFGVPPEEFVLRSVGMQSLIPSLSGEVSGKGVPVLGRESKDVVRQFAWRAGHALEGVMSALCGNTPRQRRMLGKCFSQWNAVLQAAQLADADSRVKQFGLQNAAPGWWRETILVSWTVETVSRLMAKYILLGFPSQLYAVRELLSVFWYLEHVLATLLHNVSAREGSQGAKKSSNSRGSEASGVLEPSADLRLLHTYHFLCKGTVRMLVALKQDGKLQYRELKFNTEEEMYEQRFDILRNVSVPEHQSYAKFVQGTDSQGLQVNDLLQLAHEYFQSANAQIAPLRKLCEISPGSASRALTGEGVSSSPERNAGTSKSEEMTELEQIEHVTLRNITALQVSHRAGPGSTLKATFDFSTHPFFPVVSLRRS